MKKFLLATVAAIVASPAFAAPVVVNASGSGWCTISGSCNSGDTVVANNYASAADGFRNFFSFVLPTATAFSAAQISIWSDANNQIRSGGLYQLVQSSAFSYAGFGGNTVLASVDAQTVDNGVGRYVTMTLNADGLAALSAAAGGAFRFGGASTGNAEFFGYTNGTPVAFLTLETAAVPEASTWAMMVIGFGAVGAALRRRTRTSVTFA